jgi:threonine dehydrogenase-like Zn-dependent dehydrogenase
MAKMKGFAMLDFNKVGWAEVTKPVPGPRDAVVRPIALSPCTSDIHTVYEAAIGMPAMITDSEDHALVLGHEGVGEVVEVGKEVKDFKEGDKVLIPAITPDWSDVYSQAGYSTHCGGGITGLGGWKFSNSKHGTFGEYIHINDADGNIAHLPEEISPEVGAMLSDMIPTGMHASEISGVTFGDTVAVIGIGPVGLMALRGAVLHGAGRVFGVGSRPKTVEVAKKYGATDIVNYREGDIVEQILDLNGGPVDKVLVAGGDSENTFVQAMSMLKPGGAVGNVNYLGSGEFVRIPRVEWGFGMANKKLDGGLMPGGRLRMEKLASLVVNGRIDPSLMLTHKFNGFEKIEEAVELMHNKPADLIKPVVTINW